jgi:hypothetical protein
MPMLEVLMTLVALTFLALAAVGAGTLVALIDERRVRSHDHRRVHSSDGRNAAKVT